MRKKIVTVCQVSTVLLVLGMTSLQAQVVLPAGVSLPASGHLAGAMNSAATENGNEFLFFPWPPGPAAKTVQSGWIEIEFGERDGARVPFDLTFKGRGSDAMTRFATGQTMVFTDEVILGSGADGVLNLETGEIESIVVSLAFENSIISTFGKLNRLFATLNQTYPPDPALLPPGLPPGFVFADAAFMYGQNGEIVGFQFIGQTAVPIGFLGFLPFLPPYSFGPGGQSFFSNPAFCSPQTPLEACPSDETHPEGLPLGIEALIHPNVSLYTNELREVPAERRAPSCAPTARADAVVVELAGKIYQIGGTGGVDRRRVDIYDPATGAWQQGPPLPVAVSEAQGAATEGRIYVAGGRRAAGGPASALLQVFDLATGTWSQLTPAPIPLADGVAVTLADRLYLLGGKTNRRNGSPSGNLRFASTVQIYDAPSDTWVRFPALVEGARLYGAGAGAAVLGNEIFLINGLQPDGSVSSRVAILDTVNHRFRPGPPTLHGVYDATAVRVGQRVFLAGGRGTAAGPSEGGVQVFEVELGIWKRAHDQPLPMAASAAAEAGGVAYFLGGRTVSSGGPAGVESGVVQAFDPARGWQVCGSHPIFTSDDVLSTAGLAASPRLLSPGAQATIAGHYLAGRPAFAPPGEQVPTELAGVRVTVDGEEAPILAVAPGRIDFQIPYGVATGGEAEVQVHRVDAAAAPPVRVPIVETAPSLFVQSCGRVRDLTLLDGAFALACHADGSLNTSRHNVRPGERLVLQMTGLGAVDAALANGERAAGAPVHALVLPEVRLQGADGLMHEAVVLAATLAPGEVGIYDVEIVVPEQVRTGTRVLVEASSNGVTSNRGAISVGRLSAGAGALPCLRDTQPLFRACAPLPPIAP